MQLVRGDLGGVEGEPADLDRGGICGRRQRRTEHNNKSPSFDTVGLLLCKGHHLVEDVVHNSGRQAHRGIGALIQDFRTSIEDLLIANSHFIQTVDQGISPVSIFWLGVSCDQLISPPATKREIETFSKLLPKIKKLKFVLLAEPKLIPPPPPRYQVDFLSFNSNLQPSTAS